MVQAMQKKQGKGWLYSGLAALVATLAVAGALFRAALRQVPWQQGALALALVWALAWCALYALCRLPQLVRAEWPRAVAVALCGLLAARWLVDAYGEERGAGEAARDVLFALACDPNLMGRSVALLAAALAMPWLYRFNEEWLRRPWFDRVLRFAEWVAFALIGAEFASASGALRQMTYPALALNAALLAVLCWALYGLVGRLFPAACLTSALVACGAVANYYVWQLRGTPLLPADLPTLVAVAQRLGEYRYLYDPQPVLALVYLLAGCVLAAPLRAKPDTRIHTAHRAAAPNRAQTVLKRVLGIALCAGVVAALNFAQVQSLLGIAQAELPSVTAQCARDGFVLTFFDHLTGLWA